MVLPSFIQFSKTPRNLPAEALGDGDDEDVDYDRIMINHLHPTIRLGPPY